MRPSYEHFIKSTLEEEASDTEIKKRITCIRKFVVRSLKKVGLFHKTLICHSAW